MSLFPHYPASPEVILSSSRSMLAASRGVSGVSRLFGGRTRAAAAQTDDVMTSPVLSLDKPVDTEANQLSAVSVIAGGALGLFAGAVGTYNKGVDTLNEIYERAKAESFFAEPVGEDETGSDGKPLSAGERRELYGGRVSAAKSALVHALELREAGLMRDLDNAANGTAALLDKADDPGMHASLPLSPVPPVFPWFPVFGGGGSDSDEGDDDDGDDEDDGGGFLSGVGDVVSGGVDVVTGTTASITGFGAEAWDRGSTFAVYGWDTTVRRVTNPGQTIVDTVTGTALLEDLSAAEGILGEDGELVRDGEYCGEDAACLTDVSVPDGADAITTGHTIRFSGEDPPPDDLVAHEMQHVYDIEDAGALGFYGTYAADYISRRLNGESHEDAYENILWERRAYDVGDNYPDKKPEGFLDE